MSMPKILMPEPVPEPEVFPAKSAKIIDNIENRVSEEETKEQPDMVVEDVSSDEEPPAPVEPDKEEDVFKTAPSIKPGRGDTGNP